MAAVLSFSPADEHVYFPSVCGGRGHTLTTPPAPHPTLPHPHPTDPHLDHPSPTYPRMNEVMSSRII